jgi:hypothetical protein
MATAGTFVFNRGEISLSNLARFPIGAHQKVIVPLGVIFFCESSRRSVYFSYFLDPDQGQTGPVSWEVAPLPPPRPVPIFSPVL